MRFGTTAVHAGQSPDPTTGAIMTPIYCTSTYVQEYPAVVKDGYDYSRGKNPTRTALEYPTISSHLAPDPIRSLFIHVLLARSEIGTANRP